MKFTEEHIEDFILGRLSREEEDKLRKEMHQNENLEKQVENQRLIIESIKTIQDDEKTEDAIRLAATDYFSQEKVSKPKVISLKRNRLIFMISAAAACLLTLLVISLLMKPKQLNGPELFAANFQPASMLEFDRSTDGVDIDSVSNELFKMYQAENFDEVLSLFESQNLAKRGSLKVVHYTASAALSKPTPDFELGERLYQRILEEQTNIYTLSAHWNLALLSIRKNDPESAKVFLNNILNAPQNKYSGRAKTILDQL